MASAGEAGRLRLEVTRLTTELNEAIEEKCTAAKMGLKLFEEKENLEVQVQTLERQLEQVKSELFVYQDTVSSLKHSQFKDSQYKFEHEDHLLQESTEREEDFIRRIAALEVELRTNRSNLLSIKEENKRLSSRLLEVQDDAVKIEKDKSVLREELKESRQKETAASHLIESIEDENVTLQQQVSRLKSHQIDNDALRDETGELHMQLEQMRAELEDMSRLKERYQAFAKYEDNFKNQLDEMLQNFQSEREQKLAIKREFEQFKSNVDVHHISLHEEAQGSLGYQNNSSLELSILSELKNTHSLELDKEIQMLAVEAGLQITDDDFDVSSEMDQKNVSRLRQMASHYKQQIASLYQSNQVYISENDQLRQQIKELPTPEKAISMETEIRDLQRKNLSLRAQMRENETLTSSLKVTNSELQSATVHCQDELLELATRLLSIYQSLAEHHSEQCLHTLLERLKTLENEKQKSPRGKCDIQLQVTMLTLLQDEASQISRLTELSPKPLEAERKEESTLEALQAENITLKQQINAKREQMGTLRAVLRANKQTAEVAVANLKMKYSQDRQSFTDSVSQLRTELKSLKHEAATWSSLRTMFVTRCDANAAQIEELRRKNLELREEKRTVENLLRMSIQQKMALTTKLEQIECSNDVTRLSHRVSRQKQMPYS